MGSSNTDRTKSVKRVINRLAYSTLTSQLIHHTLGESPVDYSYGGEYYDDEQELWLTRGGAYWILRRDKIVWYHQGDESDYFEENLVEPVSHDQAQDWLERYANHKVDAYFTIAEAGSKEAFIHLRTTRSISTCAKILAKSQDKSVNTWINGLIVDALRAGNDTLLEYKQEIDRRKAIAKEKGITNVK